MTIRSLVDLTSLWLVVPTLLLLVAREGVRVAEVQSDWLPRGVDVAIGLAVVLCVVTAIVRFSVLAP